MMLGTGVSRFGNTHGISIAAMVLIVAVIALMLPSPTITERSGPWSQSAPGAPAHTGLSVRAGILTRQSAASQLAEASRSLALGAGPAAGGPLSCGTSSGGTLTCSGPSALTPHPAATPIGSWINVTKAIGGGPSGRGYSTMTYDAQDGYVLLFGGIYGTNLGSLGGGTALGDTWTYQDGIWTDISPNISPSARELPFMAYDPADHEVVFFGGESSNGALGISGHGDTWTFANGTWVNITLNLSKAPSPRFRGAMAYDAYDGYLVLFGGSDPTGGSYLSDTWKFVSNTWTSLTVTGSPPGRARASMAYDPTAKELVLFGGSTTTSSPASDTWVYKNLAWTLLSPATFPNARLYYQMTTDDALAGVILYGGGPASATGAVAMNDTWLFKGGTWTNLTKLFAGNPGKRGYEFLAYDPNGAYLA
ncbi:MAG: kelch repeat-containing protein, partial [Thermoplasmata archaeon]|nr:kelch repeat-containing protein [Thermoplasmata archaeon]